MVYTFQAKRLFNQVYINLHITSISRSLHLVPVNESSLGLSLANFNILDERGKVTVTGSCLWYLTAFLCCLNYMAETNVQSEI